MAKKEDTAMPVSEKARVTQAGEEGMAAKRTKPDDLDDYSGTYVESETGEEFGLKKVPDHPQGHTHHLKNELHFHALNEADFKKMFEKK